MSYKELTERLQLIFEWYKGMVNEKTGRLQYMYYPEENVFSADGNPIRDIASIWDVGILSNFLNRQDLQTLVRTSSEHFGKYCLKRNGYMILDPQLLREPSSIAHSAFMILSLLYSP